MGGLQGVDRPRHYWAKCTVISAKNIFFRVINRKKALKYLLTSLFAFVLQQNLSLLYSEWGIYAMECTTHPLLNHAARDAGFVGERGQMVLVEKAPLGQFAVGEAEFPGDVVGSEAEHQ
jgi:hypothetical protein